jgi:hypothetical protein
MKSTHSMSGLVLDALTAIHFYFIFCVCAMCSSIYGGLRLHVVLTEAGNGVLGACTACP